MAVSDLALLRPLPQKITKIVEALVGCVAGAVLVSQTARMAKQAGLVDVVLTRRTGKEAPFRFPQTCPECGSPWDNQHERCTSNCQTIL